MEKRQRSDVHGWKVYKALLPDIQPFTKPRHLARMCGWVKYIEDRRKNRRVGGTLYHRTQQTVIVKHETGYSVIRWDELSSKAYRRVRAAGIGDRIELIGLARSTAHERTDHYQCHPFPETKTYEPSNSG